MAGTAKRGRIQKILIVIGAVIGALMVIGGLTIAVGQVLARRSLHLEVDQLYAAAAPADADLVLVSDLDGLPEPVQRWLRNSNVIGNERARTIRLKQSGELRQDQGSGWTPFNADQYFTTDPPQFLWRATFRLAFIPFMEVRDSYRDGRGKIAVKLASLIPVGTVTGPETDHGTLVRFLSEIVWFPSAALGDYIEWSPVDSESATATVTHGGVTTSAVFYVDEAGRLTDVVGHRYFGSGGDYSLEQWSVHFSDHAAFDEIQIPIGAAAVWNLKSGDFFDIHLEVTDIDYNVREPY